MKRNIARRVTKEWEGIEEGGKGEGEAEYKAVGKPSRQIGGNGLNTAELL